MTKTKFLGESVITGYLLGKSFDEISNENNISKGSVFNIVNTWTAQIRIPDLESIREFSRLVRKSGVTIKQCAQGFRFIHILASFGINDEIDSNPIVEDIVSKDGGENEDDPLHRNTKKGRQKKDPALTSRDDFYYFVEFIYNTCKNHGIKSTNIIQWMQDLIEIGIYLFENAGNKTTELEKDIDELIEHPNLSKNKKPLFLRHEYKNTGEIQIPFVSKLSGYLEQKRIMVQNLNTYEKTLRQETADLEEQKKELLSRITNLRIKENKIITYLDWYSSLKDELLYNHGIKLEKEVGSFAKAFSDFKRFNYDAHEILKEYKEIESLRGEREKVQGIIESLRSTQDDTQKKLSILEERENYSRQSLNTLLELSISGFGFKELKQLKNTIVEIVVSNDISGYKAGEKFLKDVENHYDNKLGFETKVNELRTEIKKLENELPGYKEYLVSNVIMIGSLQYLYKFGVTDDDIINMTHVVSAYLNGNITFDPNLQSENIVDENKLIKKTYYWKSFINELRNLGNINSQIIKQRSYIDTVKKEIDDLNSQRQEICQQTLLSGQLLNFLNTQIFSLLGFIKQTLFSVKDANKIFFVYQPLFFVYNTTRADSKDDDNSIQKDK